MIRYLIIISIILSSCASSNKRHAQLFMKHYKLYQAGGGRMDSLGLVIHDTITVKGMAGRAHVEAPELNYDRLLAACDSLVDAYARAADSLQHAQNRPQGNNRTVPAPRTHRQNKALANLQKTACPPVSLDSVFRQVQASPGGDITATIHVWSQYDSSGLSMGFDFANVDVPYDSYRADFTPESYRWSEWVYWLICGIELLIIIGVLFRKK